MPGGDFQQKFVDDRLRPLDGGRSLADIAAGIVDGLLGPLPDPDCRARAIAVMSAVHADTYRAAVRCLVGFDERANLPAIRVPVLCLAGAHDRNAPAEMMARMAGKIKGAAYHCLPTAGHLAESGGAGRLQCRRSRFSAPHFPNRSGLAEAIHARARPRQNRYRCPDFRSSGIPPARGAMRR